MEKIKEFVTAHPWGAAAIVFTGGLLLIWLFFSGRGSSATSPDNSAYYGAQAAAVDAGGAVYGAQIAANAQTAQTHDALQTQAQIAALSAGVANTQANDALAGLTASIDAELAALRDNNASTISLANIGAGVTQNNNATVSHISDNAFNLGSATLNDQYQVAEGTLATNINTIRAAQQPGGYMEKLVEVANETNANTLNAIAPGLIAAGSGFFNPTVLPIPKVG